MNAEIDASTLEVVIAKATADQRRYLLEQLLAQDAEESGLPILVKNKSGEYIGYYMPRVRRRSNGLPRFSAEQEREFKRRLDTLDDTITHEEMMAALGLQGVRLPRI